MPPVDLEHETTASHTLRPTSVTHLLLGWALLLPLIFFAVRGNFSFQNAEDAALSRGNSLAALVPTRNMGVLGYVVIPGIAYSIVMWLLTINLKRILSLAVKMKMLTLLALLTILSAFWSQNPVRSAYNGLFYLIGTLFAFYLVLKFEPKQIMNLVMLTGASVCILGWVLVVFPPHIGLYNADVRTVGSWRGIFPDRTSAAKCLTFLLSPALIFGYERRFTYRRLAYILLVGTSIVMAHAVTALFIGFVYTLFMAVLYLARRLERRTALVLGLVGIPTCALVIGGCLPYVSDLLAFFGRDLTLTGRTALWKGIVQAIYKRPIQGYGYYAFWQGLNGESAKLIVASHWVFGYAHNGMLEILLQLGLVGLIVFLVTLFQAIQNARICFARGRSIAVEWYTGILFLTLLYNIDEATVLFPNDLQSILYVLACCGLAVAANPGFKGPSRLLD
jgi:exopolysaccharide production protein ExoQ